MVSALPRTVKMAEVEPRSPAEKYLPDGCVERVA
jgi:hypothetical protein